MDPLRFVSRGATRVRRAFAWAGIAAALLFVLIWIASERWWVRAGSGAWTVQLRRGAILVSHDSEPMFRGPAEWATGQREGWEAFEWNIYVEGSARFTRISVPLSLPAAAGLLVGGLAWWMEVRARRRIGPHVCRACGYDLTGLPDGRRCPECGRGPQGVRDS